MRRREAGRDAAGRRIPLWPVFLVATAVLLAGVAMSRSSLAYWNDAEQTQTLSVVSGTAALVIEAPSAAPGSTVYPGASVVYAGGRFANTGDVPLTVTATRADADAFASALLVRIGATPAGQTCTPDALVPAGAAVSLGIHAAGVDYVLCVSAELPATATVGSGAATSVTLTFAGVQP